MLELFSIQLEMNLFDRFTQAHNIYNTPSHTYKTHIHGDKMSKDHSCIDMITSTNFKDFDLKQLNIANTA